MEHKRPGDSNHITRAYFDSLLLEFRQFGAGVPNTALTLFGEEFSTPVMMAALSHLDKCRENGMVEMAKGAQAAGAVMWAGMGDDAELAAVCRTGAKTVKIIKPYADNDLIFRKIEHAKQCGVLAVGMDIDHAFNKAGQPDTVLGFSMSPKSAAEIRAFIDAADDVPFVIKGVLSVRDAVLCAEAGAGGIVVSHHHGILDYAVPPLLVLPDIAKALAGSGVAIFVDCGVESGIDVMKALALGATAVSVGRAVMEPLKAAGAAGVKEMVTRMTDELRGAMARTASSDLAHIDPTVIWKR